MRNTDDEKEGLLRLTKIKQPTLKGVLKTIVGFNSGLFVKQVLC